MDAMPLRGAMIESNDAVRTCRASISASLGLLVHLVSPTHDLRWSLILSGLQGVRAS